MIRNRYDLLWLQKLRKAEMFAKSIDVKYSTKNLKI